MADILVLPGIERRDLAGEAIPSEQILQAAIDQRVTDVIVVGRDRTGKLYVAGEVDVDRAVGMLMGAVGLLSMSEVINSPITNETS